MIKAYWSSFSIPFFNSVQYYRSALLDFIPTHKYLRLLLRAPPPPLPSSTFYTQKCSVCSDRTTMMICFFIVTALLFFIISYSGFWISFSFFFLPRNDNQLECVCFFFICISSCIADTRHSF